MAYALTVKPDGARVGYCHRCGYASFERPVARPSQWGRDVGVMTLDGLQRWAEELWHACVPIGDSTIATNYLRNRQCEIPPEGSHLQFHRAVKHHPSGAIGPALVGLVTDVLTNRPISLQRTWIQANGDKAKLDPPRMLATKHRKRGGAIRLWPDEAVTRGLGIAEGVETALAIATHERPIWSCIDAGNLATFPVLEGIECLRIYADHDSHGKGLASAKEVARRWTSAGREAHIYLPPEVGDDWNDVRRRLHG